MFRRIITTGFYSIFFVCLLLSMAAKANVTSGDGCLSEHQQVWDKKQTWYLMDASCPVGKGIWSQEPDKDAGVFWVQCGMLSSFPEPWLANLLKKSVSEKQILLKLEDEKYRCLVGPFYSYSKTKALLGTLREHPALKSAFIRDVTSSFSLAVPTLDKAKMDKAAIDKTEIKKPDAELNSTVLNDAPVSHSVDNVVTRIEEAKYGALSLDTEPERYYFKVAGLLSPKPRLNELTYFSEKNVWWRATFDEANNACSKNNMTLISTSTLKSLASSAQTRKQLPDRLPFWVAGQSAFDVIIMQSMNLSSRSALYVLCEFTQAT